MQPPLIDITLTGFFHKGAHRLGICFANHGNINTELRQVGAVWSQTHKCWHVPLSKMWYEKILTLLKDKSHISRLALDRYLKEHPDAALPQPAVTGHPLNPQQQRIKKLATLPDAPPGHVAAINQNAWMELRSYMMAEMLSVNTMYNYLNDFALYLQYLQQLPAAQQGKAQVVAYMVKVIAQEGIGYSTANGRLNAIKKYYEGVLHQDRIYWKIPRAQKKNQLPKVLHETEIRRLFAAVANLKHKAILFTAYSAGLRVSDIVNLRISDIDSQRMQIRVADSKGGKDRYVGLGILTLDILRAYLKQIPTRPKVYLFEGMTPGTPYSTRSAQLVFKKARDAAQIKKEVSFHSLRHSFATHLLEKGTDIRYIKDLLGHFSIKTTERYLHVKRQDLIRIINPLDELYKNDAW